MQLLLSRTGMHCARLHSTAAAHLVISVTTMAGKMVMTLILPLSASEIDSLNLRARTKKHSAHRAAEQA
jgi:hypothetical protein